MECHLDRQQFSRSAFDTAQGDSISTENTPFVMGAVLSRVEETLNDVFTQVGVAQNPSATL